MSAVRAPPRHPRRFRRAPGFSLVLVLLLLAAMALACAATLRMATASHKVGTGFRMQALALQSAEAGLRYCAAQLRLPDVQRPLAFQDQALPQTAMDSPAWIQTARWSAGTLPGPPVSWVQASSLLQSSGLWPQCLIERQSLDAVPVYLLTVRGFSPDWQPNPGAVTTLSGSSVWLQTVLFIQGGRVRDQVQRRLLLPPVR